MDLKNCVIHSDVHSCLFHAITSKEEEMIVSPAA